MKKFTIYFCVIGLIAILLIAFHTVAIGLVDTFEAISSKDDPNLILREPTYDTPEKEELRLGNKSAVRRVQLCKPTGIKLAFPDEALCIRNRLFAQIGRNDGLYTLLKPKRYSANSVGSNCSFTVRPNCEVENE